MQNRPDKTDLLEAVARFLERDVKPAIKDPSLAFRVLIAANLAAVVAGELRVEDAATGAELDRLRALLPELAGALGPDALATRSVTSLPDTSTIRAAPASSTWVSRAPRSASAIRSPRRAA